MKISSGLDEIQQTACPCRRLTFLHDYRYGRFQSGKNSCLANAISVITCSLRPAHARRLKKLSYADQCHYCNISAHTKWTTAVESATPFQQLQSIALAHLLPHTRVISTSPRLCPTGSPPPSSFRVPIDQAALLAHKYLTSYSTYFLPTTNDIVAELIESSARKKLLHIYTQEYSSLFVAPAGLQVVSLNSTLSIRHSLEMASG